MATLNFSILSKTLTPKSPTPKPCSFITSNLPFTNSQSFKPILTRPVSNSNRVQTHQTRVVVDGDYSSRRSSSSEPRKTI
ncbi:hypothetical protein HanIR_Chr15g0734151 [Helianthus annuus]|nr:hypothetical protein HanIR_Chr15g0734151 [Helianthus annuus]